MQAPPEMEKAPLAEGDAQTKDDDLLTRGVEKKDRCKNPLHQGSINAAALAECIEAAENYERALALKHHRLRKFILCMKVQQEMLDDLAASTGDRSAAA